VRIQVSRHIRRWGENDFGGIGGHRPKTTDCHQYPKDKVSQFDAYRAAAPADGASVAVLLEG
jgi:hypothetical protein